MFIQCHPPQRCRSAASGTNARRGSGWSSQRNILISYCFDLVQTQNRGQVNYCSIPHSLLFIRTKLWIPGHAHKKTVVLPGMTCLFVMNLFVLYRTARHSRGRGNPGSSAPRVDSGSWPPKKIGDRSIIVLPRIISAIDLAAAGEVWTLFHFATNTLGLRPFLLFVFQMLPLPLFCGCCSRAGL